MLVCDFIMLNLLNKCHGVAQLDDMAYRRSQRHVRSLETAMGSRYLSIGSHGDCCLSVSRQPQPLAVPGGSASSRE